MASAAIAFLFLSFVLILMVFVLNIFVEVFEEMSLFQLVFPFLFYFWSRGSDAAHLDCPIQKHARFLGENLFY